MVLFDLGPHRSAGVRCMDRGAVAARHWLDAGSALAIKVSVRGKMHPIRRCASSVGLVPCHSTMAAGTAVAIARVDGEME